MTFIAFHTDNGKVLYPVPIHYNQKALGGVLSTASHPLALPQGRCVTERVYLFHAVRSPRASAPA
jgi:hypothetical protein